MTIKVEGISPILNVSDVPASILWFEKLGWKRGFTWNHAGTIGDAQLRNENGPAVFASVVVTLKGSEICQSMFLCCDGQGARDPRPCPDPHRDDYGATWQSWWVADCDAAYDACVKAGVEVIRSPKNEPWHVRECLIRHPDGHYFRISGPVK